MPLPRRSLFAFVAIALLGLVACSPIGVYKATFCADVGLDEPMLAERRFYVISWPFLVGFAASLLAVTLVLVLFFKRFKIRLAPRSEASSPEE